MHPMHPMQPYINLYIFLIQVYASMHPMHPMQMIKLLFNSNGLILTIGFCKIILFSPLSQALIQRLKVCSYIGQKFGSLTRIILIGRKCDIIKLLGDLNFHWF